MKAKLNINLCIGVIIVIIILLFIQFYKKRERFADPLIPETKICFPGNYCVITPDIKKDCTDYTCNVNDKCFSKRLGKHMVCDDSGNWKVPYIFRF